MKETKYIHIFAYILYTPLVILWLLLCFLISLIGMLLIKKRVIIDLDKVKNRETICSVLNKKNLITDEEYEFETVDVASLYDELTFRGYLFVLNPIIYLLKKYTFADKFILYIVKKWMHLHHFENKNNKKPKTFFSILMQTCVILAGYVGQVLYRINPNT